MNRSAAHTVRIALIVSMGGFIFGFDASVISGAVRFILADFDLGNFELGLVVGAPTLAGVFSAATAGPLSDRFGRRTLLISVAALYLVSALLSAFSTSYTMLVIARFLGGLAFGSLGLAPVYISEVASAGARGRLVSCNQFNIVIGFSAAYFANYLILQLSGADAGWAHSLGVTEHTWRWMLGIEIIPAGIWLLLLCFIPETPRWLILNGQVERGRAVQRDLVLDQPLEDEVQEILRSAQSTPPMLGERIRAVFGKPMRLILAIGMVLSVSQQITGINAIYFYAPSIFEQSGIGTDAAFAQAVVVGLVNVVFTILSMLLIDYLGRRPLLLLGLAGIAASMLLCAWTFNNSSYQLDGDSLQALGDRELSVQLEALVDRRFESDVEFKNAVAAVLGPEQARQRESELIQAAITINPSLVLIGILGFVASFAFSLGPVMWVMLPEIFPNQLRGVAMAVTGTVNSAVSFAVQLVFPWQLNTWGASGTFLGYAVFAVFFLLVTIYLVPETSKKSLEEIERELIRS